MEIEYQWFKARISDIVRGEIGFASSILTALQKLGIQDLSGDAISDSEIPGSDRGVIWAAWITFLATQLEDKVLAEKDCNSWESRIDQFEPLLQKFSYCGKPVSFDEVAAKLKKHSFTGEGLEFELSFKKTLAPFLKMESLGEDARMFRYFRLREVLLPKIEELKKMKQASSNGVRIGGLEGDFAVLDEKKREVYLPRLLAEAKFLGNLRENDEAEMFGESFSHASKAYGSDRRIGLVREKLLGATKVLMVLLGNIKKSCGEPQEDSFYSDMFVALYPEIKVSAPENLEALVSQKIEETKARSGK